MNDAMAKLDWQTWMLILLATSALVRNGFAAYNKILDRIQANKQNGNGSSQKHFEPCDTLKSLQNEHNKVILDLCQRMASVESKTERIPIIEKKLDGLQRAVSNGFLKSGKD